MYSPNALTGRVTDMSASAHETKLTKNMRAFLSFVLFVLVAVFSISLCAKTGFANKSTVKEKFVYYEYASGIKNDVKEYAVDLYTANGISCDNLDSIFTYEKVYNAVSAYYGYNIADEMEYSQQSYEKIVNEICSEISADIEAQLKNTDMQYNSQSAKLLENEVNEYFKSAVELPYIDNIKTALNVSSVALYAAIGVSGFFMLAVALITFFVGTKRFRSVRAIGISFWSAGIFELAMALVVYIISCIKRVDLFPVYLSKQFYSFVYMGISNVVFCAGALLLIAVIISAFVWKMRKNS